MHSTTSCDCEGVNCRRQVAVPESSQKPVVEKRALNIESPESPEPQEINKEFPCYTQSFLEEENDNAMDVGDVTKHEMPCPPSLESDNSVSSGYGYPTDSDSGYSSIKDLSYNNSNVEGSDKLISEDLENVRPKKLRPRKKRVASCALSDTEDFCKYSDSDDEDSHSLDCNSCKAADEVGRELDEEKKKMEMELALNDRYLSFSEKFGEDKKSCNLTIVQFYANEIQKLSGVA
jgi:hypothetical protein